MNKLVLVLAGLLLSTSLFASDYAGDSAIESVTSDENADKRTVFTITDDSPAAQLCLASLHSTEAVHAKARELRIRRRQLDKIDCNGMSLDAFARAHESNLLDASNIATVQ